MPGGAPGLQNQCGADKVPGGFDSHSPPPFLTGEALLKLNVNGCGFNNGKEDKNHRVWPADCGGDSFARLRRIRAFCGRAAAAPRRFGDNGQIGTGSYKRCFSRRRNAR